MREYIINGDDIIIDGDRCTNAAPWVKELVASHNELKAEAYCELGMSYKSRVEDLQHSCNSSSTRYWALVHKVTHHDLPFVTVMKAKEWIVDNVVSIAPAKDNKVHSYDSTLECDDETFRFFEKMTWWNDSDTLPESDYECVCKLEDGTHVVGHYDESMPAWVLDGYPRGTFKWRRI